MVGNNGSHHVSGPPGSPSAASLSFTLSIFVTSLACGYRPHGLMPAPQAKG